MAACPCMQRRLAARCETSVWNADRLSLSLPSLGRALRCVSCSRAAAHMSHARRRHALSPFSSNRLPLACTQAAAGFADVCPRPRFQHRLFSCQCADSDFSTLSYEMRDGDAAALARSPSAWQLTWVFKVRPVSECLSSPPRTYGSIRLQCKKEKVWWSSTAFARNGWMNATPNPGLLSVESTLCQRGLWSVAACWPTGSLSSGDLVHKPSFKKFPWLRNSKWNMLPNGWTYSRWNERYSCQAGGTILL